VLEAELGQLSATAPAPSGGAQPERPAEPQHHEPEHHEPEHHEPEDDT
jgi:hypothetical protein